MLAKLRPRSIYDILAAIGCFAALTTGVAYAAETIGSDDVINDSLLSEDIKNETLRGGDLAPGTIGSSRVADGTLVSSDVHDDALTGTDIKNGTIGSSDVAADSLGGGRITDNSLKGTDIEESSLNLLNAPTLRSGQTEKGGYAAYGAGKDNNFGSAVNFRIPLAAGIPFANLHFVGKGGTPPHAACPGSAVDPKAAPGHFCMYEADGQNRTEIIIFDPSNSVGAIARFGFGVQFKVLADGRAFSYGSWAVTAP
jgi:hypothetical protein